jgi:ribosomal protein S18 acetylase RimI-like enzyme
LERWAGKVLGRRVLEAGDLAEIRALATLVNRADGLNLKLNWDLMQTRSPEETSDFCAYKDGHLLGYVALDGDGSEAEMTGMVHPAHRRRGIATALVAAARAECRRRGTARLLLVCERASPTGRAFATALGTRFSFAEYHLELDATIHQTAPTGDVQLRQAARADIPRLAEFQVRVAESEEAPEAAEAQMTRRFDDPGSRYYFALVQGEPVGQLGVLLEEDQIYIRGVGVLPEYRRRGYGRQMLAATVGALQAEGHTHFSLDVATENDRALDLYRSCGFHETNVYEYYKVPLA